MEGTYSEYVWSSHAASYVLFKYLSKVTNNFESTPRVTTKTEQNNTSTQIRNEYSFWQEMTFLSTEITRSLPLRVDIINNDYSFDTVFHCFPRFFFQISLAMPWNCQVVSKNDVYQIWPNSNPYMRKFTKYKIKDFGKFNIIL